MAKKKMNWYATINRSSKNQMGTKVRLYFNLHPQTLTFLKSREREILELQQSSPDSLPSFQLPEEAWTIIAKELKIKSENDKFTKIYYKTKEICIINHIDYKGDIYETELLRTAAAEKREKDKEVAMSRLSKSEKQVMLVINGDYKWKHICYVDKPTEPKKLYKKAILSLLDKNLIYFDKKDKLYKEIIE